METPARFTVKFIPRESARRARHKSVTGRLTVMPIPRKGTGRWA